MSANKDKNAPLPDQIAYAWMHVFDGGASLLLRAESCVANFEDEYARHFLLLFWQMQKQMQTQMWEEQDWSAACPGQEW